MTVEKKSIRFMAIYCLIFCLLIGIIFISAAIFGIFAVEKNVALLRTILILSCLFCGLICCFLIDHYCYKSIYKIERNQEMVEFIALLKRYRFAKNEEIVLRDTYGRFILKIGKTRLLLYKFMCNKEAFTQKEVDWILRVSD